MGLGTVPRGPASVSEKLLHLAGHARKAAVLVVNLQAETYSGFGKS